MYNEPDHVKLMLRYEQTFPHVLIQMNVYLLDLFLGMLQFSDEFFQNDLSFPLKWTAAFLPLAVKNLHTPVFCGYIFEWGREVHLVNTESETLMGIRD